jgi:hypothetical protein
MYQLLCANYLEKTSNIDYKKNVSNDMSVFGILIMSSFVEVTNMKNYHMHHAKKMQMVLIIHICKNLQCRIVLVLLSKKLSTNNFIVPCIANLLGSIHQFVQNLHKYVISWVCVLLHIDVLCLKHI